MAERTLSVCESCGKVYAARQVESRLVVPTDDGRCSCGEEQFSVADNSGDPGLTGA